MGQQKQQLQVQASHFKSNVKRYGLAIATTGLMTGANAAGEVTVDVSSVITTILNGVQIVSSIGLAVLSLVVTIKIFKWARASM